MARAARHSRGQARRLGLLTAAAVAAACAVMEDPPGGPPDFAAPVIDTVIPDSGAVAAGLNRPLRFRFNEVISEQSGGGLPRLVEVSPRHERVNVSWARTAIDVKPKGGWLPDVVYQVRLLPGISDLRNNRMKEGRTVVFSTGGPIPDTRVSGIVLDWDNGREGKAALVEVVRLPDSLTYWALADSVGQFALSALPLGQYWVAATIDANTNRRRERREAFDSATVQLDSVAAFVFWAFARDTLGPQLRELAKDDSVTVRLTFGQRLAPGDPDTSAVSVFALPDTTPVAVLEVWEQAAYDTVKATRARARADSTAAADTAAAADTVPAAPQVAPPAREPERQAAPTDTTAAAQQRAQERARVQQLLAERPVLSSVWVAQVATPFTPGGRYLVVARARNVGGVLAESRSVLVLPAARDST